MKSNKYILAALVLIASIVSYLAGYTASSNSNRKNYEAACFYADVVHCAMDSENAGTSEEVMEIYSGFADGIDSCNFKALKAEHLREYYWCY